MKKSLVIAVVLLTSGAIAADPPKKALPLDGQVFEVAGHTAFLIPAKADSPSSPKPWVWYAPTLPNLPGPEERWMFERFRAAGIAIAGIDAGESCGSPAGNKVFDGLYAHMIARGYLSKPVLLGRSRGGLMTLSWAAANPDKVGGFAGIYPVCDLASYPGIERAAGAFGLKPDELNAKLKDVNPVDRLEGLAKAKVPLFAIHGDVDTVVPLEANSGRVRERYTDLGGSMTLVVASQQGHNMWSGFFQCRELVEFVIASAGIKAAEAAPLIGYTELRTNLPGGRHANVRTMRTAVVSASGTAWKHVAEELAKDADAWTQFGGWSPDGKNAIVSVGWQSPENAKWEEENKQFRMDDGRWRLDSCLLDLASGKVTNVTAVNRVSHYNGGLFYLPDGKGLGFTPLIKGVSRPFIMDLDGRNKRDVSGTGGGFAYGYSASPDGKHLCYHENYQLYVSEADGSNKKHIETGHPFDFAPKWSPDGKWLLFLSGEHYNCHPHIIRPDGTGLRKLADRNGYRGVIEFLDVFDFHGGSSDVPAWSTDGAIVFYTAQVGKNVELFRTTLDGKATQLTKTADGSLHYHPQPSPNGRSLVYGSLRNGARNIYVMNLADRTEMRLTDLKPGSGAMWPHWQPTVSRLK
ncbi:MAG TPA: prolyl oligopeptidase family serine peptidase [Gemmataceae bacterium]|jgi:Tol biopolymer transport system component|nr:prolyl oligopeptidase family serine peptidase [Gemmataceae bacterium]